MLLISLFIHNNYKMKAKETENVYVVDLLSLPPAITVSNNIISAFRVENAQASGGMTEERSFPTVKFSSNRDRVEKNEAEDFSTSENFSSDQYISRIREKMGLSMSSTSAGNTPLSAKEIPSSHPEREKTRSLASKIFPLSAENSTGFSVGIQSSGLPSGNIIPLDYLENIKLSLQKKWRLPEEKNYSLTSVVSFRLKKDGTIADIILETSSGVRSFDESAMQAVKETGKLEPLPPTYKLNYLDVTVKFNMRGIE